MLNPITALSVAGNIVQFVGFGLKATSKAREIYHSPDGALEAYIHLEVLTEHIAISARKLSANSAAGRTQTVNHGLDNLCALCAKAAQELLTALRCMKVSGAKSKVQSSRKALKILWGKKRVDEMKTRLEGSERIAVSDTDGHEVSIRSPALSLLKSAGRTSMLVSRGSWVNFRNSVFMPRTFSRLFRHGTNRYW